MWETLSEMLSKLGFLEVTSKSHEEEEERPNVVANQAQPQPQQEQQPQQEPKKHGRPRHNKKLSHRPKGQEEDPQGLKTKPRQPLRFLDIKTLACS